MSNKALEPREVTPSSQHETRTIGRYVLYGPIARGGMATVHFARLVGGDGFSRIVAAKRLHEQFAEDPEFVEMFRNEARIASCVHHPNVVPVLDLVVEGSEVLLVQEYVRGVPLDKLLRVAAQAKEPLPTNVIVAIIAGVLSGLHAAHEAKDERGEPLRIIHRDVTPHNIVVGEDGVARLLDFGIAKARSSSHVTREGFMKGKLTYMAPEQLRGEKTTRKVDVYSAGVVVWELLTGRRLHAGRDDLEVLSATMAGDVPHVLDALADQYASMGEHRWYDVERLAPVVAKMMTAVTADRYETAEQAMIALVGAVAPAPATTVGEWVKVTGREYLARCQHLLRSNEDNWRESSRIAIAAPLKSPSSPESGVRLAARPSGPDARETVPEVVGQQGEAERRHEGEPFDLLASKRTSSSYDADRDFARALRARGRGRAGWTVAALLLGVLVALIALLFVRPSAVLELIKSIPLSTAAAPVPSAAQPPAVDEPTPVVAPLPPPEPSVVQSAAPSASAATNAVTTAPRAAKKPPTQNARVTTATAPNAPPTTTSPVTTAAPLQHAIDVDSPY